MNISVLTQDQENRFWDFVKFISWPCDYKSAKYRLMQKYTKAEIEEFRSTEGYFISRLTNYIDNEMNKLNQTLELGDDSFGDLMAHIVGLGKDEYYKHLSDYRLIVRRANEHDYQECFTYCFPFISDWEEIDAVKGVIRLKNLAKRLKQTLEGLKQLDFTSEQFTHQYISVTDRNTMEKAISALDLASNGKWNEFIRAWQNENLTPKIEVINSWLRDNESELPHKFYSFTSERFDVDSYDLFYNDVKRITKMWVKP